MVRRAVEQKTPTEKPKSPAGTAKPTGMPSVYQLAPPAHAIGIERTILAMRQGGGKGMRVQGLSR